MKSRAILNRWLRRRGRSESGQALVEVALVGSLLVFFLMGVLEFGQVTQKSIAVSNAARAGVQYGAQTGYTAQDTTGIQNAAAAAAPSIALVTTSSYGCVCSDGSASTCAYNDCSNSHILETVTVNTQATFTPVIKLPGFPSTYTLKGQAIQACNQ